MSPFLLRHLFESTLFCLLLSFLACCLRRSAAARYAVWLMSVAKFAIPSVLLTATGAHLASFWPAGSWLSSLAARTLTFLTAVLGALPLRVIAMAPRAATVVWAFGIAAMFSIWFARLRNFRRSFMAPAEEECAALVRASRTLRVRTRVQLRSCHADMEPALLGIRHPVITIPQGLHQQLNPSEFEAVLLHELAHLRRMDNLTSALVHCLVCIFWFHPLLWFIEKRLRVERERACDELVIACGVEPQTYASGILKVCKFHLLGPLAGVSAMTGSDLKHRLESIYACRSCRPMACIPRLLIAGIAVLMSLLPMAGGYCEQCVSNGQETAVGYCGQSSGQGHDSFNSSCKEQ